jgi:hypothetical protein
MSQSNQQHHSLLCLPPRYLKCVSSTKNECTGDCGWNTRVGAGRKGGVEM